MINQIGARGKMKKLIIVIATAAVTGICAGDSEQFWRGITAALLVLIYYDVS